MNELLPLYTIYPFPRQDSLRTSGWEVPDQHFGQPGTLEVPQNILKDELQNHLSFPVVLVGGGRWKTEWARMWQLLSSNRIHRTYFFKRVFFIVQKIKIDVLFQKKKYQVDGPDVYW